MNILTKLQCIYESNVNTWRAPFNTFANQIKTTFNTFESVSLLAQHLHLQPNVSFPEKSFNHQPDLNSTKSFISNVDIHQQLEYQESWSQDANLKPIYVLMLGLRGFPEVQGGIETHVEHLAPELVNLGCNLEVIVRGNYQNPTVGKHWKGVKLTPLWAPKSKSLEAIVHTFLGVLYAAVKRPDILHIHGIGPALMTPLARLLGLRVVVTHHGPDYNRQKWGVVAQLTLKLGEWFGMRFSNRRITISSIIQDLVTAKHTVNSSLIHNGVVLPELTASIEHLARFGLEHNKYILLVGRLVPEKRHLDLIQAFNQANLSGYKLVFVGSSEYPDAYAHTLTNASITNPNIVLTGFQRGEMLHSLYAHAALFVLPSSHEGLSISLLEAMSYGLPVIASNIPANLEVGLSDASYFDLGNINEITRLLMQHLEQTVTAEEKLTKKKLLRDWVTSRYDWKNIAKKTVTTYFLAVKPY